MNIEYYLRHIEERKQYYQDSIEEVKQDRQDIADKLRQAKEQGRRQAEAKYNEYLQTTSDEPKKTFKTWHEQKLMIIEDPKILQQTEIGPDEELITKLEKLLRTL